MRQKMQYLIFLDLSYQCLSFFFFFFPPTLSLFSFLSRCDKRNEEKMGSFWFLAPGSNASW